MLGLSSRSRFRLVRLAAALLAGPGALLAGTSAAAAATCAWQVFPTPNGVVDGNQLLAVNADSATDAWAAGITIANQTVSPLAEHWNGAKWQLVRAAGYGRYGSQLSAIAGLNSKDAWAVGWYSNGSATEPMTEHWNGTKWAITPTPTKSSPYGATLNAVAIVSADDVWAVGGVQTSNNGNEEDNSIGLIEHWNGVRWSIVPSPDRGTLDTLLLGVTAVNANDVWATGVYGATAAGFNQTFAEHWNGVKWSLVATPDALATTYNNFNAVASLSADAVFASGDYYDPNAKPPTFRTLAGVWNGRAWSLIPSANAANDETVLAGAAAVSPTEVLSVGSYIVGSLQLTFVMLWDGSRAVSLVTPDVYKTGSYFDAASRIPGTSDAWVAGGTLDAGGSPHQTLIERYHC